MWEIFLQMILTYILNTDDSSYLTEVLLNLSNV